MSTEKTLFAEHLSLMIKGGVSLAEALDILEKETKSRSFRKALRSVSQKVLAGESLNGAMERHPKIFDRFYRNIVRVGEESGSLEQNLKYLAEKLKKDNEIKKKVVSAMIYPAIVISLALVVAFGVVFFVLPQIAGLFETLKISLPFATRALIGAASFLQKYWPFLLVFGALAVFLFKISAKVKTFRLLMSMVALSLPVLGGIIKNLNLSYFSRTFYALLKSGVPLSQCLEILSGTLPNEIYRQKIFLIKKEVETGGKISEAMKKIEKYFPAVFSEMVLVGERSGSLEESFLYLAEYHEKEADGALKNLSSLIEPALLILIGIFVAFVVWAVIIPIYQFTGQIRIR